MYPPRINDRFKALELKGVVRRVRTAAGVAKYGQPIGSVIVMDKMPERKKRNRKLKPPVTPGPKATIANNTPREMSGKPTTPKASKHPRGSTAEGRRHVKQLEDSGFWLGPYTGATGDGDSVTIEPPVPGSAYRDWRAIHKDVITESEFVFRASSEELLKEQVATNVVTRRNRLTKKSAKVDSEGRRHRNEKKRDYEGFFDLYEGVRGMDWSYEGDPEVDWDDVDSRRRMADLDAAELGITYGDPAAIGFYGYGSDGWDLDINGQETINGIARVHEERLPGFMKTFIAMFGVDNSTHPKGTPIAWNGHPRKLGGKMLNDDGSYRREHNGIVGLPTKYWGDGYESKVLDLDKDGQMQIGSDGNIKTKKIDSLDMIARTNGKDATKTAPVKFHSVSGGAMADEQGIEEWRAAQIITVTHELGHSIGRVMFNEFNWGQRKDTLPIDDDPMASVGNYFRGELLQLLEDYGIIKDTLRQNDYPMQSQAMLNYEDSWLFGVINKENLKEHLSTYGASNFHEMMAETWSAYMLHPSPGDFVRELGSLMEDAAQMFIEETEQKIDSGELKAMLINARKAMQRAGK